MESLFYSPNNDVYIAVSPRPDAFQEVTNTNRSYGAEFNLFMNEKGVMDEKQKQFFYTLAEIEHKDVKMSGNIEEDILSICKDLNGRNYTAKPVYSNGFELSFFSDKSFLYNIVGYFCISNISLEENIGISDKEEINAFINLLLANYSDIRYCDNIGDVSFFDGFGNLFRFNHHVRFDSSMSMIDNLSYVLLHNNLEEDKPKFLGKYNECALGLAIEISIKDRNKEYEDITQITNRDGEIFVVALSGDTVTMFSDNEIKNIVAETDAKAERIFNMVKAYKSIDIEEIILEEDLFNIIEPEQKFEILFGDER